MKRLPLTFQNLAALSVALAFALSAEVATATIAGMSSGVTVDGSLNITGLTVPGGKAFTSLETSSNAELPFFLGVNAAGEAVAVGTAHNLNLNVPLGFFLAANGFQAVDLLEIGGLKNVKARDDDGAQQDFVLSDFGGNDNFSVAAILPGGVGARVNIDSSTFGHIQFNDPGTGDPFGQQHGFIAFDVSDLLDENGSPLAADASIRGVRVYEHQGEIPGAINQRLDLLMFAADVVEGVPEPSTMLLVGLSLTGLLTVRRRMS